MRVSSDGQVTIPADILKKAGLSPNTDIECLIDGDGVRVVRAASQGARAKGRHIVAHLRGRGDLSMSTDEIMALTREG